jgi:hypothetical protein
VSIGKSGISAIDTPGENSYDSNHLKVSCFYRGLMKGKI